MMLSKALRKIFLTHLANSLLVDVTTQTHSYKIEPVYEVLEISPVAFVGLLHQKDDFSLAVSNIQY